MQFVRGQQADAIQDISSAIADSLREDKRVLWLTSGGSNTELQVQIMDRLHTDVANKLERLAILPIDERYGPAGHGNSNTEAMRVAGFKPGEAIWIDVLAQDKNFDDTLAYYQQITDTMLDNAQVVIGQIGMGDDMHIAGIKPDSPAIEDVGSSVVGYDWSDYKRLTLSAVSLRRIQLAFVPAFGAGKQQALENLQANTLTFAEMPAKLLYDLPAAYVYNDFINSEE